MRNPWNAGPGELPGDLPDDHPYVDPVAYQARLEEEAAEAECPHPAWATASDPTWCALCRSRI